MSGVRAMKRIPVTNVASSWCGQYKRRGDNHNPRYCAACRKAKKAFWDAIRSTERMEVGE